MEQKIFCVGFNKTGTASLHLLFKLWGMKSLHCLYNELSFDDELFSEFQCFCDGESHDFKGLDKAFTGSKFILTTRRLDDWLVSRIKHVEYRRSINKTGLMRREYEQNPETALNNWINRRVVYYREIQNYFSGRDDTFIKVNICDSTNQKDLIDFIASFLNLDALGIREFPRANISAQRYKLNPVYRFKTFFTGAGKMRSDETIRKEVYNALRFSGLPEQEWYSD
ncbi:MAG TPA: hypothetical protein VJ981_02845 [Gammaproteobacteria bacterium]|nr:hypothetical protein [Gammaproteobacteria bacterium]